MWVRWGGDEGGDEAGALAGRCRGTLEGEGVSSNSVIMRGVHE